RALVRFWLAPLLGSLAVLAGTSLASFVVVRAAETLHASDEYVGLLLAGSTWPALAAFLIGRWLTRRRQGPGPPPPPRVCVCARARAGRARAGAGRFLDGALPPPPAPGPGPPPASRPPGPR